MTVSVSTQWPVNAFNIAPRSYHVVFKEFAGPSHALHVSVRATDRADVFFVDGPNFALFKLGQPFQYYGQQGVLGFDRTFQPPAYRDWYLVVFNRTDQISQVTVSAALVPTEFPPSSGSF